jgi:hypothetical protein
VCHTAVLQLSLQCALLMGERTTVTRVTWSAWSSRRTPGPGPPGRLGAAWEGPWGLPGARAGPLLLAGLPGQRPREARPCAQGCWGLWLEHICRRGWALWGLRAQGHAHAADHAPAASSSVCSPSCLMMCTQAYAGAGAGAWTVEQPALIWHFCSLVAGQQSTHFSLRCCARLLVVC